MVTSAARQPNGCITSAARYPLAGAGDDGPACCSSGWAWGFGFAEGLSAGDGFTYLYSCAGGPAWRSMGIPTPRWRWRRLSARSVADEKCPIPWWQQCTDQLIFTFIALVTGFRLVSRCQAPGGHGTRLTSSWCCCSSIWVSSALYNAFTEDHRRLAGAGSLASGVQLVGVVNIRSSISPSDSGIRCIRARPTCSNPSRQHAPRCAGRSSAICCCSSR